MSLNRYRSIIRNSSADRTIPALTTSVRTDMTRPSAEKMTPMYHMMLQPLRNPSAIRMYTRPTASIIAPTAA